jgi:hypothetical protein
MTQHSRSAAWLLAAVTLATAGRLTAHHSDSVYFVDDRTDPRGAVRIEGTVTRVRLINPHAEFFVSVRDDSGETAEWAIESDSWTELGTLGRTQETLAEGDRVAAVVSMSKFHATAGRLRDMLIQPRDGGPATLFLEYIPDASDEFGQSDAPLRLLERAPQCEGTVRFDPARERGEETLLCITLDAATLEAVGREFSDRLLILR